MKKAIIIFSGGIDSICTAAYLKPKYELYGITFKYGQRATREINVAKNMAKKISMKKHVITNIDFMKMLYADSNILTKSRAKLPSSFDYSIVIPIRNAIFLSIASAWGYSIKADLVAYGAHTGDSNYPDCRPAFAKKIQDALNQGEIDGIKSGLRKKLVVWSPYIAGFTKSNLLKKGYRILKDELFKTWSCYTNEKLQCGRCESCMNRKKAFASIKMFDKTKYAH